MQLKIGNETASVVATRWVNQDIASTNFEARQTRRRLEIIKMGKDHGLDIPKDVLDAALADTGLGTKVHKYTDMETSSDEEGLIFSDGDASDNLVDLTNMPSPLLSPRLNGIPPPPPETPLLSPRLNGIPPPPPETPTLSRPRASTSLSAPMPSARTREPSPAESTTDALVEQLRSLQPVMQDLRCMLREQMLENHRKSKKEDQERRSAVQEDRTDDQPSTSRQSPLGKYSLGANRHSPVNIVINTTESK